jgi:hypothetical protein
MMMTYKNVIILVEIGTVLLTHLLHEKQLSHITQRYIIATVN